MTLYASNCVSALIKIRMTQFMKVKAQEIRMTNKHLHILSGCIYYIISYVSKILINKVIKNRILNMDIHNFGLEYTL